MSTPDQLAAQEFIDTFTGDTGCRLGPPGREDEVEETLVESIAALLKEQREKCAEAVGELDTVDVPHGAGNYYGVVSLVNVADAVSPGGVIMSAYIEAGPAIKVCPCCEGTHVDTHDSMLCTACEQIRLANPAPPAAVDGLKCSHDIEMFDCVTCRPF